MMYQKKENNHQNSRKQIKKSHHMKATGNADDREVLEGHMPSVTTKQRCVKSMLLQLQNKCAGITTYLSGVRIK